MKELFYKSKLGDNPRKSEISIEEISARSRNKVSKKWMCKYFIKERFTSENKQVIKEWIRAKTDEGTKRDCHILRHVDTRTGENKIICKILGEIFVVSRHTAYRIMYLNELKITIDQIKEKA
ncbi:MAG: hypothetical protein PHH49_00610 [Candidatus Omnitrophica bacterium]|nr:hypothetical protein [Candidatus Omnitrophota bacterium]MDD5487452.1 hypothetical protein [Candidatus Omnitrophota bacterium]